MKLTIPVLSILAVAAFSASCNEAAVPGERAAAAPLQVTTATATVTSVTERLEAGGIVAAHESAVVSSRIVAPVLEVRVKAGDSIRRGDVLVRLDARDLANHSRQARAGVDAAEQSLVQARAARAAAEADHGAAVAWHTRIISLHGKNSATAQERDDAEARLAGAAARLAGAEAAITAAEANITGARASAGVATTTESFTVLRAPFDGVVTERLTDPGNLATPGVPLLRIDSTGDRRVEATVDEARAAFIDPGDRVEVLLEGGGSAPRTLIGTVTEIARAIAADQRTFVVKVALPPGEQPRTGTFARVRLEGPSREAVTVPASAIRRHGQITSVFVVAEGIARVRLIQAGATTDDTVEVLAGLDAGEVVVTAPPPQLADAHPVTTGAAASTGDRQ